MTSMILANAFVDLIKHGGLIMYPILMVALVAIAVVGERSLWWIREGSKRDPESLEKALAAMENSDFRTAVQEGL
jgi:biopolymer transport protein ExbB